VSAALTIRGLAVARGATRVLRGLDLDVASGEIVALMGGSGAGKTTILRTVAALQPFDAGAITVGDVSLAPGPLPPQSRLRALRDRVGMVFQSAALFEHLNVIDNLTLAPIHVRGTPADRARDAAHTLLASLGVGHRADALPREISGGEAQRVAIARALALEPLLLLMDEPTSALDPARRSSLGDIVRRLAAEGRGLLVSTHDIDFARGFCDRVAVLVEGAIVETGPARDVLSRPTHEATRALMATPLA
jgi:polar amino acid transport system ATP-binding protein